jgi:5-methylcytosine-specific restriction protein A
MAKSSRQICSHSGCFAIALEGSRFCARHSRDAKKPVRRIQERKSANERGYTYAWQKARYAFLMEHPLCAECLRQGRNTPATCVDHIIPHKGNMDLFWDQDNWQALCDSCHSTKTAKEDGGFGNARKG